MDRVRDYVHNLGEWIAEYIDRHDSHFSREKVHVIAELCDDYNHVCKFVQHWCDHHDGSLYHREDRHHGMAARHDEHDMMGDNPRRRR